MVDGGVVVGGDQRREGYEVAAREVHRQPSRHARPQGRRRQVVQRRQLRQRRQVQRRQGLLSREQALRQLVGELDQRGG